MEHGETRQEGRVRDLEGFARRTSKAFKSAAASTLTQRHKGKRKYM